MPHNYTLRDTAKLLGTGQNRLTRELKAQNILDHKCLPRHQADIDAGRFVVKLKQHRRNPSWNQGKGQLYHQTYVTQKGLRWLADRMGVDIQHSDEEHAA